MTQSASAINYDTITESDINQFVTFFLDGQLFGIPVNEVKDVFHTTQITPVPLSSREIRGVINIRGHIFTALSLRERLKLPPNKDQSLEMYLSFEYGEENYCLVVDEIGDVLTPDLSSFEDTPSTLNENWRSIASGIYKLDQKLMIILDIDKVFGDLDKQQ